MLHFLFVSDRDFVRDETAVGKQLGEQGQPVLAASISALEQLQDWNTTSIEVALRAELLERLQLKPRNAFGPLRVAITGRQVSPPLFESMELLGRDSTLARMRSALS